jgi:hypothetical protein
LFVLHCFTNRSPMYCWCAIIPTANTVQPRTTQQATGARCRRACRSVTGSVSAHRISGGVVADHWLVSERALPRHRSEPPRLAARCLVGRVPSLGVHSALSSLGSCALAPLSGDCSQPPS